MGVMRRREFLRGGALALASWRAPARAAAPHVLIAGGGFAGACCALQLRQLAPAIRVTLIDPQSHYVTCPMSNEVVAGLRTLASITTDRPGLGRAGVQCVLDQVTAIDAARRRVRLRGGGALAYDTLVVAPGIRFLFGQPEGYTEAAALHMPHAWQAGAQTEAAGEAAAGGGRRRHRRDQRACGPDALPAGSVRARQPHRALAQLATARAVRFWCLTRTITFPARMCSAPPGRICTRA